MTSTTNYQKRKDLGEVTSMLFGILKVTPAEATKVHSFFADSAPQYVVGDGYTCLYREPLVVEPSHYYRSERIYDVFSTSVAGESMEMIISVTQRKAEGVEEGRYHYKINIVIKGGTVSEEIKKGIEERVKTIDTMLFGIDQAKRAESFSRYAQ
ncbi:hypothetical protein HZC31_07500 [Candidatus Woesearchaeota archaeon]|nr:hypothetical protein [Candidatus Woesearchaeota archaeon]